MSSAEIQTGIGEAATSVAIFGGRGAGALAAFTLDRLGALGQTKCLGFLNDVEPVGTLISGHPILGGFASWRELSPATRFIAPLHKAKEMPARADIIRRLGVPRARWANIIDPQAVLAPDVTLGVGLLALAGCSVMCGARLGDHVTIRNGGHVGHDCTIGDFVMIGANALVCGYGTVQEGAHIAPGAVVRDGTTVGRYSVVGLGAVVTKDVPDGAIVAGNPARVIASVADASPPLAVVR
jgi:sugar O-acyltransferase (sialic acid O-acetyltransferase NeuD family)